MRAIAPIALAILVIVQAGKFMASSSGTYDETVYLHMAEANFQQRDNAQFASMGVAPLPVLLQYALPTMNFVPSYAQAILLARMCAVAFIAVPLVLVVFYWMLAETSVLPAVIAATLVALSPNIVAHGSIATTDACFVLFALVALWTLTRYIERPTWTRLLALIAGGALAFAAKYSGVTLFGVTAIALAWLDRPQRTVGTRLRSAAAITAAVVVAALAATWNYHPLTGVFWQISHQRLGHEAYFFGQRNTTGWWYYQPVALVLKSTYVELAAFTIAIVAFASVRRGTTATRVWGIVFGSLLMLSMASRVSIGVRYILLLVPLAIMAATVWMVRLSVARPPMAAFSAAVGIAAVAGQAITSIGIAPRYLSYFNGLAGGPMQGYRALADSNLDWGQDLPAMRQVLASVGARQPLAAYFGSAPWEDYDVHIWSWTIAGRDLEPKVDWVVISATYLVGLYLERDPFEAFRAIEPTARPTPSLFVYDASRPEVKAALALAFDRK